MIRYSIDSNVRIYAAGILLALALIIAWLVDDYINAHIVAVIQLLGNFGTAVQKLFPYSISFLTFWGLSWEFFDRYGWKIPGIRYLVGIPDLSGHWTGLMHRVDYVTGSKEGNIPAAMNVTQTFSRISIRFWSTRAPDSKAGTPSDVTLAGMTMRNSNAISVYYAFQFFSGKGLCEMTFLRSDKKKITGQYVSTVPRVGSFNLTRA